MYYQTITATRSGVASRYRPDPTHIVGWTGKRSVQNHPGLNAASRSGPRVKLIVGPCSAAKGIDSLDADRATDATTAPRLPVTRRVCPDASRGDQNASRGASLGGSDE